MNPCALFYFFHFAFRKAKMTEKEQEDEGPFNNCAIQGIALRLK